MSSTASQSSSHFEIISGRSTEGSLSSDESFDTVSDGSQSDDEIVWSVSDLSASLISITSRNALRSPDAASDDFILVDPSSPQPGATNAPRSGVLSPSTVASDIDVLSFDGLSDALSDLRISTPDSEPIRPTSQATVRKRRKRTLRASQATNVSPPKAPAPTASASKPKKKARAKQAAATPVIVVPATRASRRAKKKASSAAKESASKENVGGLGERPIVDDVSEAGDANAGSVYTEASQYISSFLSTTPGDTKPKSDLALLQALIIELGVLSASSASPSQSFWQIPTLPRSLKAATKLLKSSVFVNVRDYLSVREKGLEALRRVMHPSRKALVKDLTKAKGKNKVPRGLVKNSGLSVLLVSCYH